MDPPAAPPDDPEKIWMSHLTGEARERVLSRFVIKTKDGKEPPLPSPAQMAKNLAKAIVSLTTAILRGNPGFASMTLWRARRAVCENGERLDASQVVDGHCSAYRPSDGRCGSMRGCGCFVIAKAAIATEKCPLDRWPRGEET